jgi:hypothetical protein
MPGGITLKVSTEPYSKDQIIFAYLASPDYPGDGRL